MRILIVGCGGVGGYFGPRLLEAGEDVAFLVRPATARVLQRQGLELQWPERTERVRIPALTSGALAAWTAQHPPDYVWLTVKCYDLKSALNDLAPALASPAGLVTCQNGLGTEELAMQRYPTSPLVGGIAYVSAERTAPGIVQCRAGGGAAFGSWPTGADEAARRWVDLWMRAGLTVRLSGDVRCAKWEKLCWNAVFNALTAGLRCPLGEVLDAPALRRVGEEAIHEIAAVARAQGLTLDVALIEKYFRDTGAFREQHTSMYMDLVSGRPTEIDWINGAIVRLGERLGVPTPVNRALRMLVKMQERLRL